MRKHGGDGLLGKGVIFGFDVARKSMISSSTTAGEEEVDLSSMSYSTVTPLHDANDYNDGCMHGTDLSFYSIACLCLKTYSERAGRRGWWRVGSSGLSFAFLSCAGYKRASYTAVARSARLCYSDERSFLFVR